MCYSDTPFSPEVRVHSPEPGLFSGQSSVAKDGFEVDPATLDLVEVMEVLIQVGQPPLPE